MRGTASLHPAACCDLTIDIVPVSAAGVIDHAQPPDPISLCMEQREMLLVADVGTVHKLHDIEAYAATNANRGTVHAYLGLVVQS
jgi:hypothetical protein